MTSPNAARERHLHDPYAPRRPEFPRARLERSGVTGDALEHLQERYDDMTEEQAVRWSQRLRAESGTAIRTRFTMPEGTQEEIRAALEDLHQGELRDLAAAEGVHLSGTNAEIRDRLAGVETPVTPVGEPGTTTPAPAEPEPAPDPEPAPEQPAEDTPDVEATPDQSATTEMPAAPPAPTRATSRSRTR